MKRILGLLLSIICLSSICFIGCSNNTSTSNNLMYSIQTMEEFNTIKKNLESNILNYLLENNKTIVQFKDKSLIEKYTSSYPTIYYTAEFNLSNSEISDISVSADFRIIEDYKRIEGTEYILFYTTSLSGENVIHKIAIKKLSSINFGFNFEIRSMNLNSSNYFTYDICKYSFMNFSISLKIPYIQHNYGTDSTYTQEVSKEKSYYNNNIMSRETDYTGIIIVDTNTFWNNIK